MIEGHKPGCMVLYLPPYSYDMNPIEMAFSKVKAWLMRHGAEPEFAADPRFALSCALASVTPDDACGYMKHSGFPCFKEQLPGSWVSLSLNFQGEIQPPVDLAEAFLPWP